MPEFRKATGLSDRSFAEQVQILREENFMLPGGWAAGMESHGVEVFETLYNDPPLIAKWAEENNSVRLLLGADFYFDILKAQIADFQPDVLFLYAGAFFWVDRQLRAELKKILGNKLVITGFWGDELPPDTTYAKMFGDLDLVFASSSAYAKHFNAIGIRAVTIGNCYDDSVCYTASAAKSKDVVFCGTTGFGYPDHVGRYEKLIELMRRTKLQIFTKEPERVIGRKSIIKAKIIKVLAMVPNMAWHYARPFLPNRLHYVISLASRVRETSISPEYIFATCKHKFGYYFIKRKPLAKLFSRSRVKKPLLRCSDYYSLLADSKIVLNLHRDEEADIGNIRCYEATGVGSCLLTDHGDSMREFFDIDNEIVTFTTVDECLEKITYLLSHPEERERIARNGQARTLSSHTVANRCRDIVQELRNYLAQNVPRGETHLVATYDMNKHPISYDVSFFLQAADIQRKLLGIDGLIIQLVNPDNIDTQAGVSEEVNNVVDGQARMFRVFHIVTQMCELLPNSTVINVKDRNVTTNPEVFNGTVVEYPPNDVTHHAEYYRLVNHNPDLMAGFEATVEAHRFVDRWLSSFLFNRDLICVTLRQYRVDTQRNSDVEAWSKFLGSLDCSKYAVVVLPDTDHIEEFKKSALGCYPTFEPACFDVDLRFALYERAFLNMSVNNGPTVAATLSKKIRYLLFKFVVPSVPHCSVEFMSWLGFHADGSPDYAGKFQKWVWEDDTYEVLNREFKEMVRLIRAG
ncbi:MAG: glycosyltransferase [Proteobacteria bacterium]|nr:glycosyltransferase [Pseudomonadota bacterium]